MSRTSGTHLTFWGATETVTGSRFLLESRGRRVLVDCGLFQGLKKLRLRNWEPFPVDPASIDEVILTHAHIDHSGYLPALVRDGFTGPIHCTEGTAALARILLPDAAHLQEEDAREMNARGSSRHHPALPLYDAADAQRAISQLNPLPFHEELTLPGRLDVVFSPVGHILGAASVRIDDGEHSVTFTGDVGRPGDPIMRAPEALPAADVIVTESTYGNRSHPPEDPLDDLEEIVKRTVRRGGSVLIPSFAVGRAQTLLWLLSRLRETGRIPDVPTYLNSPMAVNATELFVERIGEHRLSEAECRSMCDGVRFVRTAEESKWLTAQKGPMIVLSASGMMTGGRVLHHLERLAPDRRNTIVLAGYQAAGTRGEAIRNGAREIKVFGSYLPVRAEVAIVDSLSAHADASELTEWLAGCAATPSMAYVVHGEPAAADAMRRRVRDELGWQAEVPEQGRSVVIDGEMSVQQVLFDAGRALG